MNKQIAIAALVANAVAQVCEDAFTEAAQDQIDQAKADLAAMQAATAGLTAAAAITTQAWETADARATTNQDLLTPFFTALDDAKDNYDAKVAMQTEATNQIATLTDLIVTEQAAQVTSSNAVDAQNNLISAQQGVVDKLNDAVTEHTTERAAMQVLLDAATVAKNAAITAKTTEEGVKTANETAKTTATTGWDALAAATASTLSTESGEVTTADGLVTSTWATYKPLKKSHDAKTKECAAIDAGCAFTGTGSHAYDCNTYTNDAVKALKTACDSARDAINKSTEQAAWEAKVTAAATAQKDKTVANARNVVALANVATIDAAIAASVALLKDVAPKGALMTAVDTTTAAESTAQTNYNTVDGQLTQATTDQTRGVNLLSTLTAARAPLTDDLSVKNYLLAKSQASKVAQEAIKAEATAELADLQAYWDIAKVSHDRAQTMQTYLDGLVETADLARNVDQTIVENNAAEIVTLESALEAAESILETAVSECKVRRYGEAQDAKKGVDDWADGKQDRIDAALAAYSPPAIPTDGSAGTICAKPEVTEAAPKPVRPECTPKSGLCCGAAQKFLKDGTRLVIETCQQDTDKVYTYWPEMKAGSTTVPDAEIWRFSCIDVASGAQKLLAAASAALAASYMMA